MCKTVVTGSLHNSAASPRVDVSTETWSVSQTGMHASWESYLTSIIDLKRELAERLWQSPEEEPRPLKSYPCPA